MASKKTDKVLEDAAKFIAAFGDGKQSCLVCELPEYEKRMIDTLRRKYHASQGRIILYLNKSGHQSCLKSLKNHLVNHIGKEPFLG